MRFSHQWRWFTKHVLLQSTLESLIGKCCMLWKQLENESTVMSLSCDHWLERATQLDQSFCAFSVPLIHFNKDNTNCCILGGKMQQVLSWIPFLIPNGASWLEVFAQKYQLCIFSSKWDFYTAQNVRFRYGLVSEEAQLKDELFSHKGRCDWVFLPLTFPSHGLSCILHYVCSMPNKTIL